MAGGYHEELRCALDLLAEAVEKVRSELRGRRSEMVVDVHLGEIHWPAAPAPALGGEWTDGSLGYHRRYARQVRGMIRGLPGGGVEWAYLDGCSWKWRYAGSVKEAADNCDAAAEAHLHG